MSNTLLLTVLGMAITGIILGMRIALGIIRSIPMFGGGYPTVMPAATTNRTDNSGGGGVTFTFLLLILFILAVLWVTTNPKYAGDTEPITSVPTTEIPQTFESTTPQPVYSEVAKPIVVREAATVKRVNQTPVPTPAAETTSYYAIQVGAFTEYDGAIALEDALADHAAIIIEEDGIYKVMVEAFTTVEAAKLYMTQYLSLIHI